MKRIPYVVKEKHFIHSLHERKKNSSAIKKLINNASEIQMRAIYEIVGNGVQNPHLTKINMQHFRRIKQKGHHKYFR